MINWQKIKNRDILGASRGRGLFLSYLSKKIKIEPENRTERKNRQSPKLQKKVKEFRDLLEPL